MGNRDVKKTVSLLIAFFRSLPSARAVADRKQLRVLTSFLPVYLFTKNVVGSVPGVSVDMMLPASLGCPHDYALVPSDMKKIAAAVFGEPWPFGTRSTCTDGACPSPLRETT
jgi:ABC-type Zn uptake system ZnuABC Zn-binding protein ZnuA